MTDTEKERLDTAAAKSRQVPLDEHVSFKFKDKDTFQCCVKCGHVQPKDGWTKPCKGGSKVTLR
jgi:hypothetical protein